MYSLFPAASLYCHFNLLHVSVKFCQFNRLTNVVRIYINSNKFDRLPATSYHIMFEFMFFAKPTEKFNSIAHCSLFIFMLWLSIILFFLSRLFAKDESCIATKTVIQWQSGFRLHFLCVYLPSVPFFLICLLVLGWDLFCLLCVVELFRWIFNICLAKYLFILTEQKQSCVSFHWNYNEICNQIALDIILQTHELQALVVHFFPILSFSFNQLLIQSSVLANYIRYHRFFGFVFVYSSGWTGKTFAFAIFIRCFERN